MSTAQHQTTRSLFLSGTDLKVALETALGCTIEEVCFQGEAEQHYCVTFYSPIQVVTTTGVRTLSDQQLIETLHLSGVPLDAQVFADPDSPTKEDGNLLLSGDRYGIHFLWAS